MRSALRRKKTGVPAKALLLTVAGLIGGMLLPAPARASSDYSCSPTWKLDQPRFTGCDSMAMLAPGNDTRVNLALLLATAPPPPLPAGTPRPDPLFDWDVFRNRMFPTPPDLGDDAYAAGQGSRCLGEAAGAAAFAAAVTAAPDLTPAERAALIAERQALKPTCVATPSPPASAGHGSPTAQAFTTYLHGAAAFYAGAFDAASAAFRTLAGGKQPWLRETARYMLGRAEVNRAQVGLFDEYGYRDAARPADPKVIAAAEARLLDYLKAYPRGEYAASARGLLRRVHWLAGDRPKLAADYAALLAAPSGARGVDDARLIEEIDDKLLPLLTPADTTDPILLAVLDLRAMRRDVPGDTPVPPITRAALEAQRPYFHATPALFAHLLATHAFHVGGDPRAVAGLITAASTDATSDTVRFSGQTLRAMALDAAHDPAARDAWTALIDGAGPPFRRTAAELGLALHEERSGGVERVFVPASRVRDAALRDILLTNVAGPALLRRQAAAGPATPHERAVALFTLLYKQLTRGDYRGFVADVALVPPAAPAVGDIYGFVGAGDPPVGLFVTGPTAEDYPCPSLRDTARRLAAAPNAPPALLCLAEFVRLNGFDGYQLDRQPPADELGGTRSAFPGRPLSRLELYKAVIADKRTAPQDRAYALFRAVRCYAPARSNSCGGADVAPAVRKDWFQRLHRDYRDSRWARQLAYYW